MKKRLLCSFLAVMMLISMLAGIVVPVSADEASPYTPYSVYRETNGVPASGSFAISTTADWSALTTDFATKSCPLNLYVTNDIDFKDVADMKPLGYVANGLTGVLDGQGHTFKNINIVKDGSGQAAHYGVSLVGSLNGGTIQNLGLTGSVTNTSTETSSKTAAFVGGKHNGGNAWIKNCWSDVYVKGPSDYRSNLAVFFAYSQAGMNIENCINYGTIETTSKNGSAAVFTAYSGINTVKNSLDLGTIISNGTGFNGTFIAHHNNISYVTGGNTYSVNNMWAWNVPSGESIPSGKTLPDGTAITSVAQVNEYYDMDAAEAAWKATNGANGEVYYKLDDTMGVTYGTATDRVQKVDFNGLVDKDVYLNVGETINLAEICNDANANFGVATKDYWNVISNGVLTVPNADITVDVGVAYSKKADYSALSSAKGWFISTAADWTALTNEYATKTCALNIYVTSDIDFKDVTGMKPLAYATHGLTGLLDGQGHTFKNINIEMKGTYTSAHYGVALVGALSAGGTIQNLGLTGCVTNTSTDYLTKTAAFVGGKHNGANASGVYGVIKNCWSDVHVKGPSAANGQFLAVFYAYPQAELVLENCINYGTVETTSTNGGAATFYNRNANPAMKNCLDLGTVIGNGTGTVGAVTSHPNGVEKIYNSNSYSVNHDFFGATDGGFTSGTVNGATMTKAEIEAKLHKGSAGEAAWAATNGANGEVYYKLDENGKVTYGSATEHVRKITFGGLVEKDVYLNNGATLDLAQVLADAGVTGNVLYGITEGYESAIEGTTLTVPNADIGVQVSEDDPTAAKDTLRPLYNSLSAYDPAYFNEGEALTAWLADADAVLKAESITTAEVLAVIASGNSLTFTAKEGVHFPYAKKDIYAQYNTSGSWGISVKEDWIKLTEDFFGKRCDLTLYVTNDIDFESTNMKPLSYGSGITSGATIYGQGYTFKNIKIEMEGGTNQYQGVALIGAMAAGGIYDLGLTGEVTNLSTAGGSARTAAFCAGANAGGASTIKNCWSSVTVKGPSDNRGRWLSVFYATPAANRTLENCINYGTVQTTSTGDAGANVFYGYSAQCIMKNCLDLGTITVSGAGVGGAIASHHNGIQNFINTNSYSTNLFWGKTHTFAAAEVTTTMPDGSAIETAEQVDALFAVGSAAEAAWKATNGANGTVFYKLDDTMGVTYGTATDRVWRVSLVNGSVVTNYYGMEGLTVELPEAAAGKVRVVSGATVEGNTLTIGQSDATVSYIDYEDSEFYAKKAALQAKIDSFDKYNPDYIGNWAAIEAWIAEAEALIADPYATDADVVAKTNAAPALAAAEFTYPNYPAIKEYNLYKSFVSDFAVADKADWNIFMTCGSSFKDMTVHVVNDIDFASAKTSVATILDGTLDGHGHVLRNLNIDRTGSAQAGLLAQLNKTGTIKNLGLTGTLTCSSNSNVGSFAGYANGKISGCWSTMTIDVTDSPSANIGGLIGRGSGCVIENSYFAGEVIGEPTYGAGGIIGYGEGAIGKVKNSFVAATGVTGIDRTHLNAYYDATKEVLSNNADAEGKFNPQAINSYAVGTIAVDLRNSDGAYAAAMAALANNAGYKAYEAKYSLSADAYTNGELAYKMNENSAETGVYYTVKAGKTVFGSADNKVVKLEIDGDIYYLATGAKVQIVVPEGNVLIVSSGNALVNGNIVTAGVEDAVIELAADEEAILAVAKQDLQNLVNIYNKREEKYFTAASWNAQKAWIATAEAAIAANTLDAINAAITAEADVSKAAASMTYPNYPSIEDYAIYAGTGVKNFAIGTKAEWLALIAMTEGSLGEQFANNVTIHLTADIDMKNEAMLPVAYGGKFKAALDGHGHVFKNINISVNDSVSPVGLVGYLGGDTWISNVGIESGIINVTGTITGNVHVGSIVGQSETRSYLRKCWNAADIEVATTGVSNIGGIVGRMNSSNVIDSCYNLGDVSGYGILGYGGNSTALYNCFNLGANKGLAYYHVGVFDAASAVKGNPYVNCWNKGKLLDGVNGTVTEELDNLRRKLNNDHYVGTAEEAAWEVNNGYVASGKGDKSRAWFTVDETGMVRFGTADGQPHKVTINFVADGQKVSEQVYFAAPGATIELNGELGASYFVVKSASTATLKGNMLTMGYEDVVIEGQCGLHMGDASADKAVNLFDAITVLRSIVGLADCGMAGDVNRNGRLDANDAVLIARYWLGDPNASFVETKPVEVNDNWIKIATYNVKVMKFDGSYSGGTPGANLADIVAVLKAADADILGLQEINSDQVEPLMTALNDEGLGYVASFFTPAKDETYGTAVISRYAITDSQVVKFADATDAEGNALEIDGAEPRSFARLVLDVNGKEVVFYNSHLANKSYTQLEYIRDNYLKADVDAGKNVIMTADFNLDHEHVQYCVRSLGITALNRNLESTVDNSYIDNILVSGNMDYYWDNTTGNGVKVIDSDASDHSLVYGYACLK